MKVPVEAAKGTLRLSVGWWTTEAEIARCASELVRAAGEILVENRT